MRSDVEARRQVRARRCSRWLLCAPGSVALSATVASPVGASPLDDATPSSSGMPGGALVVNLLSWGMWLGLAACGGAVLYGAATWAGFGSASAGRSVQGKTYVIAGLIGALVIGLAPTAISLLFDAGQS